MVEPVPEEDRLRHAAFDAEPLAQIVLDAAGMLVAANVRARHQFGISSRRHRPRRCRIWRSRTGPAELRNALDRAVTERRDVALKDVHWAAAAATRVLRHRRRAAVRRPARHSSAPASPSRTSPGSGCCRASCTHRSRSSIRPTRSCSRPTRSSRPPTRSCSRPSRSWRRPTRSSSPRTKNWRR